MTLQAPRITFSRSSLLLLCGLSGVLAFHEGCAIVGSSSGSDKATVSGGVAQVCIGCSAIPSETITHLKAKGITEAALNQFFTTLGRNKIPPEALDHELRDIAKNYLDLKATLATLSSEDPEVTALIQQARQAVEVVNFPLAERRFNEASQRDEQAAQHLQQVATTRLTSAAAAQAANGDLQQVQLNFVKAQAYYQKALQLLQPSDKEHRGQYLNSLGNSLRETGIRTKGADIQKFLRESVTAYREALAVYTKEQLPQDWAGTQNNLGNVLGNQGTRTGGEAGTRLLAESVTAYREALRVRTKEQLPQDWAGTQNNLGNVLRDQGTRTGGEDGTRLLAESVTAYREALTVRTKEQLPQDWAGTQNNLGTVLRNQGTRTGGEAGTRLLAESVTAYREALTVYTKEQLPQDWAGTQNNLGNVLGNQGTRTGGEAGTRLLAESVTAYRAALEIRTREHLSQDWAQTQNNLAKALLHLKDWRGAADAYRHVLTLYPDYGEGYVSATALYQEKLFAYQEAFALSQQWLERHREDLSAQANFAEAHFTTGRFEEAETRLTALLKNPKLDLGTGLGLQTLYVATLLALNKPESVPATLTTLRDFVAKLPGDSEAGWSFEGSKHFIEHEPKLAPSRAWLLELFSAIEEQDGRNRLAAVEKVRADFLSM